ncbi:type II toxin-antitoxin system YoeB family toxin [Chlorogloeopsis sp. ULAP01]|uniref:type II toxin-antitoxin system YoeB family toxin n=1 Tax=Chlorogloeopsis sp. ULAP01 TaxID=3056483 RepID=UPI0025AA6EBC|nr:type II toxin-antitoxin system YoeB family toxin [Chlorogloeopsis sp. ULAP01]MDM9380065.1 type II toxin-antitoxin system YoeB family toxin [Chlorogloeopsis sp. ULAP01]
MRNCIGELEVSLHKASSKGRYSRRINIQHRLVYEVVESEQTVKVIRMWMHYE